MPVRLLIALGSGAALATSFEPLRWWVLAPLALAGFALSVHGERAGRAWLPGLLFGVAFYFPHIVWMRAVGTAAWIALAGVETLFYVMLAVVVAVLSRHRAWPLGAAAAWATMETVRSSWPFSGMPWGRLAFGVVDTPAAPALAYLGATGVGFLLALGGFCLAAVLRPATRPESRRQRVAWGPVLGLAGVVAVIGAALVWPYRLPTSGTATVAAVQGDVPGPGDDILYDYRQVTQNHVDATVDLAERVATGEVQRPDFVLWPENSTAVDPFEDVSTGLQIERASAAIGVPVVVGAIADGGPDHVLNQGIVWSPETGAGDRYTKRHPVPYGEYIPARALFESIGVPIGNFGDLALIPRDMLSGTRTSPLRVAGIEVADAICFDIAYDDGLYDQVTEGAQLLTVQTSNATFIRTDQVEQQFAITRARAIEAGRWLVVASTNGITAVVAPDGAVVDTAPQRSTSVLVDEVGLVSGVTPGVLLGRWITWPLTALALLGLVLALGARRGGTMVVRTARAPGPATRSGQVGRGRRTTVSTGGET